MQMFILWLDEATLGFVNYFSWQQILWLHTALYEPEDDPPDGGISLFSWPRLWRGLVLSPECAYARFCLIVEGWYDHQVLRYHFSRAHCVSDWICVAAWSLVLSAPPHRYRYVSVSVRDCASMAGRDSARPVHFSFTW